MTCVACFDDPELVEPGSTSSAGSTGETTGEETLTSGSEDGGSTSSVSSSTGDSMGADSGDAETSDGTDSGSEEADGSESDSTGATVVGIEELDAGALVITELMWNPTCDQDACEWIEVANVTDAPINLLDLIVQDNDESALTQGRVTADAIMQPGERVVLARGTEVWPYEFGVAAVYGPNPGINNGGEVDRVILKNSTVELDRTPLVPWDVDQGVAWALQPEFVQTSDNAEPERWCLAATPLFAGANEEFGTPGSPEVQCAP